MSNIYSIKHSHGQTETGFADYDAALEAVRSIYGEDCEIGHDGDLSDGGDRTLCWVDAESAQDDDGSRACCVIRVGR